MKTTQQKRIVAALGALHVITKNPRIRAWLLSNDPNALRQAEKAFGGLELELEAWQAPAKGVGK